MLESIYRRCLVYELGLRGLDVYAAYPIPIPYKAVALNCDYWVDLLVDGCIFVENKTVDAIHTSHRAQLLTYLKHSRVPSACSLSKYPPALPVALSCEPLEAAGKSESPSVSGSLSGVAIVHTDYGRLKTGGFQEPDPLSSLISWQAVPGRAFLCFDSDSDPYSDTDHCCLLDRCKMGYSARK